MTHILKNLSRRLVSFRGNSGQTWHIEPSTSIELPDFEVSKNEKLLKLEERHLIKVNRPDAKESEPDGDGQDRGKRAQAKEHSEVEGDDQDRGKKPKAKR